MSHIILCLILTLLLLVSLSCTVLCFYNISVNVKLIDHKLTDVNEILAEWSDSLENNSFSDGVLRVCPELICQGDILC